MEVKIIKEFENVPQGRRELLLAVKHPKDPSPSREELRNELKETLGENFVIRKEKSRFGFARSKVLVFSYDSKDKLLEVEPEYILKREGLKEGEK